MVTAPMRILSQSASVFGSRSTTPFLVTVALPESKMKSDAGSSMSCINSFTDTAGFTSPHSSGECDTAAVGDAPAFWPGCGAGADDEHADVNRRARTATRRLDMAEVDCYSEIR